MKKKVHTMKQTIDTYKLTSLDDPAEEILSQLMKEAAEEAQRTNEEATARFFMQLKQETQKKAMAWK